MKTITQHPGTQFRPPRLAASAHSVLSIGMTVENVDRSAAFYRNVLGFEQVSEHDVSCREYDSLTGLSGARARVVRLRLRDETIELTEHVTRPGRPMPADSRSNDHWFQHVAIIVRDMNAAYARLRRFGVDPASPEPQRLPDWNRSVAGIRAFYFRDPDGHFLEILEFPPDKGHTKWHRSPDDLFLGIDHTAIVVNSTNVSVRFYRDLLGMRVAGISENFGPEQERLNNVPGVRLRVTTLRTEPGPGIELLEYLSPRNGRPRPANAKPHDLFHWHTTINVHNLDVAIDTLTIHRTPMISAAIATMSSTGSPSRSALVADPDGHVIELLESPRRD